MATPAEDLYEEDFYAWTRDQARELRRLAATHPDVALDFPHLIEEVADLGISERDAVRTQARRVIEHCLKLEYSSARPPGPLVRNRHRCPDRARRQARAQSSPQPAAVPAQALRTGAARCRQLASASTANVKRPMPCPPNARIASPIWSATTAIRGAATA